MDERKHTTGCECDRKKLIRGINCDVKNCVHHDGVSACYAGEICVGPCDADCAANTVCATFKPREY